VVLGYFGSEVSQTKETEQATQQQLTAICDVKGIIPLFLIFLLNNILQLDNIVQPSQIDFYETKF